MTQLTILNLNEQVTTTLSDAVIVTDAAPLITATCHEELAGLTELKFSTTADSIEAGLIREDYYVVAKVGETFKEFIIDNIVESDESELIMEVSASLSAVELNDSIITTKVNGNSPTMVLQGILNGTRWTVGTVDPAIRNNPYKKDTQYKTVLEAINDAADTYNCDIFYSYVIDENKVVKRQVNLFNQFGSDSGKRFEIDKDVTSIKREIDTTLLATAILPIKREQAEEGKEETVLTLANINYTSPDGNGTSPKGQLFISDKRAKQNWGRLDSDGKLHDRVKLFEYTDEDVTVNSMADLAWLSLGQYTAPKVTYTANVIDLYSLLGNEYQHEKVVLGDTVAVIDNYFTVPIAIKERVIEIDHDLLDPTETVVTLGSAKNSYTSDRNRANDTANNALDAANNANNNAIIAIVSADGKNTIYFGTTEPTDPHENDIWFKPNPDDPTVKIMQRWDGVQWVDEFAEINSGKLEAAIAEATQAGNDAAKAAADAEQAGKDAAVKADDAKKAGEDAAKVGKAAKEAADGAKEAADNAAKKGDQASEAAQEAKKAGEDAADLADQASKNAASATGKANEAVASFNALDGTVKGLQTTVGNKADKSQITQLQSDINLRVKKGDVINQINVSGESILISGNKLHITANTSIDNAVIQTAHIKDLAVNNAKLANAAITNAKIGNAEIYGAVIKDAAITEAKIGNAAVATAAIADLAVTNGKIANLAVNSGKIADAAIGTAKIGDLAVTNAKLANLSVTEGKIGNAAITTAKIKDAAITSAKIGSIDAGKITTGTLNAANVKIINLDASNITSGTLNASVVKLQAVNGKKTVEITGSGFSTTDNNGLLRMAIGVQDIAGDGQSDPATILFYTGNGKTSASIGTNVDDTFVIGTENTAISTLIRTPKMVSIEANDIRFYSKSYPTQMFRIAQLNEGGSAHAALISSGSGRGIIGSANDWRLRSIYTVQANFQYLDVATASTADGDFHVGNDGGHARVWSDATYRRTYSGEADMCITAAGTYGRRVSARKYKTDIQPLSLSRGTADKRILYMQPASWQDKAEIQRHGVSRRYYGYIADDFHDAGLTEVVQYGADGQVEGLSYERLGIYTIPILREHEDTLVTLDHSIAAQSAEVNALKERVRQLETEVQALREVA